MLSQQVNQILWAQSAMEAKQKIISVGDGAGQVYAACVGARGGTKAGDITGSAGLLLCGAIDAPADHNAPVKLWSAGEAGDVFCHAMPFKGLGKTLEQTAVFVNSMDY